MTQDEPIMDGSSDAAEDAKVAGIVEQVRADLKFGDSADTEPLLTQRLEEAGIELPPDEISRLVAEIENDPF
jgi:hypothetical protein